jgi:crotonobetainyl-CoA:carnitine CoA-transferase CaiB-like acyl-CoA transferase
MGFLDGYRVLDLTDARGLLAGRLLADLGADVVIAESGTGSTARAQPPLLEQDGKRYSFYWETYGANRRGVVYDPSTTVGRAFIRDLVLAADVVVESAGPNCQADLGVDLVEVLARSPSLIWCSISAFGLDGPKAHYEDADLVVWAAGGPLAPHLDAGATGRPPLRISTPQAYLHASADAAAGILVALAERATTGRGQRVDVSAQAALGVATLGRALAAAVEGEPRPGSTQRPDVPSTSSRGSTKWRAKDGLIEFNFAVGPLAGRFTNAMVRWMRDEGVDVGPMADWDFATLPLELESGAVTTDQIEQGRQMVARFLAAKTRVEAIEAAVSRKVLSVGILDVSDIGRSHHFQDRGFWVTLGEGPDRITVPGPFASVDRGAFEIHRAAPGLGEHTAEVAAEWMSAPSPRRPAAIGAVRRRPLDGVKVVDLSWALAGPLVGRSLADFGAMVVRVESSERIDALRLLPPFCCAVQDREASAVYGSTNAGKLGMCLDLAAAEGREVLRDLASWADVLIESFSPGTLERWGMGPAELRVVNDRLIVLRTTLCGQSGPWSRLAGFGDAGSALAGFQNLVGWPDRDPIGPLGPYTDYVGPRFSLLGVLAALDWRAASGQGCVLDVSQVEAGIWFLAPELAEWFATGTVAQRNGNRDRFYAPHGVYPCKPDLGAGASWVAIAVRDDRDWKALTDEMGRADLATDSRFSRRVDRIGACQELDGVIGDWTASMGADEVERRLQAGGLPAHRVSTSADFCSDPQLAHRGHLLRLPHPDLGEVVVEGPRYRLSETPGVVSRHAPRLHEDTDYVLTKILQYDDHRIAALRHAGVLR